jgi:hypothetical protein
MPQYAANDSQMQELKGAPKHLVQLSSYLWRCGPYLPLDRNNSVDPSNLCTFLGSSLVVFSSLQVQKLETMEIYGGNVKVRSAWISVNAKQFRATRPRNNYTRSYTRYISIICMWLYAHIHVYIYIQWKTGLVYETKYTLHVSTRK